MPEATSQKAIYCQLVAGFLIEACHIVISSTASEHQAAGRASKKIYHVQVKIQLKQG
jgi:hypothetical protein